MNTGKYRRLLTFSLLLCLIGAATVRSERPGTAHPVILCLSAHPDDEDGVALVYCGHLLHATTYSVFFTRGEGGQNETGSELDADLGEIRTRETLGASAILGSKIFFLGFPDFGFSKTARETFSRWGGHDTVLARLVRIIRALQPDVIITNHDTITSPPQRQHGNHQAVGITAYEAFSLAADPTFHPEQLREPGIVPWQTKKLFFRARDTSHALQTVSLDGSIKDTSGESFVAIAFRALAQHRSQGMDRINRDSIPQRFLRHDYLLVRSDRSYPFDKHDLFSGITPAEREPITIPTAADIPPPPLEIRSENPVYPIDLPRLEHESSDDRVIYIRLRNNTSSKLAGSLLLTNGTDTLGSQRLVMKPGDAAKQFSVPLPVPNSDRPLTLSLAADVADKENHRYFASCPVTVERVRLTVPPHLNVGLVKSYDRTTEDVLTWLQIPYTLLDSASLASADLGSFSTIILDLRAYAYRTDAVQYNDRLLKYAVDGGNLICFYHKPGDWNGKNLAPYRITLTGERVTEEDAPVKKLLPDNSLFKRPNAIDDGAWDGWVQERNIYLPSNDTSLTSVNYLRLLATSDEGENQPPTSLLTCRYGAGRYTYTSLALYRQLKNGNEGALRLFCNLLARNE